MQKVFDLGEVLQCPDLEENEGKTTETITGSIRFDHANLVIMAVKMALNDVNLDIQPGKCVA